MIRITTVLKKLCRKIIIKLNRLSGFLERGDNGDDSITVPPSTAPHEKTITR